MQNPGIINFSDAELKEFSEQSYFFGHRSVGNNIVNGLKDICAEHNLELTIIETRDNARISNHVFAHTLIGQNGDPESKISDFKTILNNGVADSLDFAFLKFCYVDIKPGTNIERLFKHYTEAVDSIHQKYPHLEILHLTVPLTVKPSGIKGFARIILGKDDNKNRNKFNNLIRQNFKENKIIDIAKIESTFPDNDTNFYWNKTPGLIPAYSSDGRHLNKTGSYLVAQEMISKILQNINSN